MTLIEILDRFYYDCKQKFASKSIESLIPSEASSANQLADKSYVRSVASVRIQIVDVLPECTEDCQGILFMVPLGSPSQGNIYSEWVAIEKNTSPVTYEWENIGDTSLTLEAYVKKTELLSDIATSVSPTLEGFLKSKQLENDQWTVTAQSALTLEDFAAASGDTTPVVADSYGGINTRKLTLSDFANVGTSESGKVIKVGSDGNLELSENTIDWNEFNN